jgi:hypothetical protein
MRRMGSSERGIMYGSLCRGQTSGVGSMRQGVYLSKGSSTRDLHILIVTIDKMSLL